MANAPKKKSETKITRIVASDSSKPTTKAASNTKQPTKIIKEKVEQKATKTKTPRTTPRTNPLKVVGGYFKGSWYELRQVRWPDRRATWGMTGALIAFTAFFIIVILLLDFAFGQLFQLITGK